MQMLRSSIDNYVTSLDNNASLEQNLLRISMGLTATCTSIDIANLSNSYWNSFLKSGRPKKDLEFFYLERMEEEVRNLIPILKSDSKKARGAQNSARTAIKKKNAKAKWKSHKTSWDKNLLADFILDNIRDVKTSYKNNPNHKVRRFQTTSTGIKIYRK